MLKRLKFPFLVVYVLSNTFLLFGSPVFAAPPTAADLHPCSLKDLVVDRCGSMVPDRPNDGGYSPPDERLVWRDLKLVHLTADMVGKNIVEFRSRPPGKVDNVISVTGHVFVLLGKELPDGSTVYFGIGGFYPKPDDPSEEGIVKQLLTHMGLNGPGEIVYKIPDFVAAPNHIFRAYITEVQLNQVEHILYAWNTKEYNLLKLNCVDLAKSISEYLGLKYEVDLKAPSSIVDSLGSMNYADTPIVHARAELERMKVVRQQMNNLFKFNWPNGPVYTRHDPGPPGAATGPDIPTAAGGHDQRGMPGDAGSRFDKGGGSFGGGVGGGDGGSNTSGQRENSNGHDRSSTNWICTFDGVVCS